MLLKTLKIIFWGIILIFIVGYLISVCYLNISHPITKWDKSTFENASYNFPDDFLWGTATAAHQVEGNSTNNNWHTWENSIDSLGKPRIHGGQKSGDACDHWNRYPDDIKLMKDLGLNAYRFSLAWSKIEPSQGVFDTIAMRHYHDLVDSCLANGLDPMVTLHHFSQPKWFDELGGFQKEENTKYFEKFSAFVFSSLSAKVKKWCTINEPNVYVTGGYVQGNFPPGKKDPSIAGEVLFNLLKAHTNVYHQLKAMPNGKDCSIGLVKDIFQFDPYQKWDLTDWVLARTVSKAFNDSTIEMIKTGNYKFDFPPVSISKTLAKAKNSCDFIGLNYYSHIVFNFSLDQEKALEPIMPEGEIKTDMDYTIYPEGLYRAIETISEIGVPIYITENGIADADDSRRAMFIKQYLFAVSEAIKNGHDIRGYYYWSLMDNFEWAEGYDMKFGLYDVDFNTQKRTLRKGALALKDIIEAK